MGKEDVGQLGPPVDPIAPVVALAHQVVEFEPLQAKRSLGKLAKKDVILSLPPLARETPNTLHATSKVPVELSSEKASNDGDSGERGNVGEWLRVPPERVDQLHAHLGELVLSRLQQDQLVERMLALRAQASVALNKERELSRALSELREELPAESHKKLRAGTEATAKGIVEQLKPAMQEQGWF